MTMNITPLGDRVLVETLPRETKTASGLYLPDSAKNEEVERGIVVAAGSGRKNEKGDVITLSVKTGDKILFNKSFNAHTIKVDEKEYSIVREDDILAVIN